MQKVLQESAESKKPRGHLNPDEFDKNIEFHTYLPPKELQDFLEHFWTLSWQNLEEPYLSEQVMHQPFVDLYLSESGSGIQGTFRNVRTYKAEGSGRIVGARFLPGAFHLLWPGAMADLQEANVPLEDVLPEINGTAILNNDDEKVILQLSEILQQRLSVGDDNLALIGKIIAMTENDDTQTVHRIAVAFGKSDRWIQQLFQDYVGVGLKWLLQRRKLLAAAQVIRDTPQPDWTAIAYDLGYSSQQHFITDFRKVTGKTPTQYKNAILETE